MHRQVRTGLLIGAAWALFFAQQAVAKPNVCVANRNTGRVQKGTATCDATGSRSIAVPTGGSSSAQAISGDDNTAMAIGDFSTAIAGFGSGNTARTTGASNQPYATGGDGRGDGQTVICT
jgi:hypothetical protein